MCECVSVCVCLSHQLYSICCAAVKAHQHKLMPAVFSMQFHILPPLPTESQVIYSRAAPYHAAFLVSPILHQTKTSLSLYLQRTSQRVCFKQTHKRAHTHMYTHICTHTHIHTHTHTQANTKSQITPSIHADTHTHNLRCTSLALGPPSPPQARWHCPTAGAPQAPPLKNTQKVKTRGLCDGM